MKVSSTFPEEFARTAGGLPFIPLKGLCSRNRSVPAECEETGVYISGTRSMPR